MIFRDSQTYKNLKTAYEGELKASAKYLIYGSKAREDGYEQIGNIFDETSGNEKEHAEIWLKWLHGGEIPGTSANLADCISGEHYEWAQMYREFARIARTEGYCELATLFDEVGDIEHHHEDRYTALKRNVDKGEVFEKPVRVCWICLNCGHMHYSTEAPDPCPVCGFPQAFFQMVCENY